MQIPGIARTFGPVRQLRKQQGVFPMMISILLPVVLGVVGQLLLKHGMTSMGKLELDAAGVLPVIWRMATSPYVVGGIVVYGVSTFFWLLTLNRVELSYAYPFLSLSYVLIFVFSWLLFRENISPVRILGMLIVILGVLCISRG
jgi:multidrug transporter EmrE-like cation transporter